MSASQSADQDHDQTHHPTLNFARINAAQLDADQQTVDTGNIPEEYRVVYISRASQIPTPTRKEFLIKLLPVVFQWVVETTDMDPGHAFAAIFEQVPLEQVTPRWGETYILNALQMVLALAEAIWRSEIPNYPLMSFEHIQDLSAVFPPLFVPSGDPMPDPIIAPGTEQLHPGIPRSRRRDPGPVRFTPNIPPSFTFAILRHVRIILLQNYNMLMPERLDDVLDNENVASVLAYGIPFDKHRFMDADHEADQDITHDNQQGNTHGNQQGSAPQSSPSAEPRVAHVKVNGKYIPFEEYACNMDGAVTNPIIITFRVPTRQGSNA